MTFVVAGVRSTPLSRGCRGRNGSDGGRTRLMHREVGAPMRGLRVIIGLVALVALTGSAAAADLPVKAPPPAAAAYDWSGFYLGGHFGYATGSSHWSATQPGAPAVTGSLDLFNAYDMFRDTGSDLAGFQAGYNYMLPSRWLMGI